MCGSRIQLLAPLPEDIVRSIDPTQPKKMRREGTLKYVR